MRHIEKRDLCTDFENYKIRRGSALQTWKHFKNKNIKLSLHQHLWQEQKGLCVYCQQVIPQKVQIDSEGNIHPSHIEHIKPKSEFPELTFEHSNLSISCEGFDIQNPPNPIAKDFCGHAKANEYNDLLFLLPVEMTDIESYFAYNIQGKIESSGKDDSKANYMIQLLHLNHTTLAYMRSEMYSLILEQVITQNLDIEDYLATNQIQFPAFHSMLQQLFFI